MCYPTQAVVLWYKLGTDPACCLCKFVSETYCHVQCSCPPLAVVYLTAHNIITKQLLNSIKGACPEIEVHPEETLGTFCDTCPADLVSFKQDAFIVIPERKTIIVWEFTRGMAD